MRELGNQRFDYTDVTHRTPDIRLESHEPDRSLSIGTFGARSTA
jgi:hypothetical protein